MKILRIVSSGFEEGGVENGIVLLQSEFEKRGHTVKILASNVRPDLPHFNHYTYPAPTGLFSKLFHTFNVSAYLTLKKVLKEFGPDVVHVHTIGHASPSILFALRTYPTVATIHGPEGYTKSLLVWCLPASDFKHGVHDLHDLRFAGKLRYFYYRYINLPLYRIGLRNVDVFVTQSRYMQKLMASEGIHSTYVPNGTALFKYRPLVQAVANHTVVYAGRLETYKGVEYALRAIHRSIARFPDARLLVAGEGSERTSLEALAAQLRIKDAVSFLGHIPRSRLEELYRSASLVIMPSIWPEAFGKVGIEAMSVGRPIIASDVGGVSDWLVSGENGLLVPPKDTIALSDAILTLFSDPELHSRMSLQARKKAEVFDLKSHATRMEQLYDHLTLFFRTQKRRGE